MGFPLLEVFDLPLGCEAALATSTTLLAVAFVLTMLFQVALNLETCTSRQCQMTSAQDYKRNIQGCRQNHERDKIIKHTAWHQVTLSCAQI